MEFVARAMTSASVSLELQLSQVQRLRMARWYVLIGSFRSKAMTLEGFLHISVCHCSSLRVRSTDRRKCRYLEEKLL